MKRLMVIALCAASFAARADKVIVEKAVDGANTVTTVVDENGYVKYETMTCLHVPEKYKRDEWVKTLERPVSGDRVVLNDTTYVLMTVDDFAAFTNKMAFFEAIASQRWKIQHRTEQGRAEWHGNRVSQTFETDESGKTVKITEYADGYRYVETAPEKKAKKLEEPKHAPVPRDFIRELRERRANGGAK